MASFKLVLKLYGLYTYRYFWTEYARYICVFLGIFVYNFNSYTSLRVFVSYYVCAMYEQSTGKYIHNIFG